MNRGPERLFFALVPDAVSRNLLARVADELLRDRIESPIRPVPPRNYHLTLVFLGQVGGELRSGLEKVAEETPMPAEKLVVDRVGHFPRPRVLWLGCSRPPSALADFVGDLSAGLESLGLKPDRRPWRPHLTIARKVVRRPAVRDIEPITWDCNGFSLMRSVSDVAGVGAGARNRRAGVRYEQLASWAAR